MIVEIEIGRDLQPIKLQEMALDLANRHAARIHRHDLLVEAREAALVTGDQLGIERSFPVTRDFDVDLRRLGQHGLLRIAIAVIGFPRRCLAIEMIVQLRVQNPLGQGLFQLVEKPVLGKNFLRIAPREKLVQCVLLDRHSPPPAVLLWPHTQDS